MIAYDLAEEELTEEESERILAGWPNCNVPDCEYKAYIPYSERCYPHMMGITPETPQSYGLLAGRVA
jgi:hypothetical protein